MRTSLSKLALRPILVVLILHALAPAWQARAQELVIGDGDAAPCPPSFFSVYEKVDLDHMTFWGRSSLSMTQWDGTKTYYFQGKTTDGEWKITGYHHVAASQCLDAYWSWLTGAPAIVVRLWNEQLTHLGSVADGGSCGSGTSASSELAIYEPGYDPYGPGGGCTGSGGQGGGGDDGGGALVCSPAYIVIEISYDGGNTWEVWWEGWGETCDSQT